jgi:hypothetical protein
LEDEVLYMHGHAHAHIHIGYRINTLPLLCSDISYLAVCHSKCHSPHSNFRPTSNHPRLLQLNNPPERLLSLPNLAAELMCSRQSQPGFRVVPADSQTRETG